MRTILKILLNVLGVVGIFAAFILGGLVAAHMAEKYRLIDESILPLFLMGGFVAGGVFLAWLFRKGDLKPPLAYLPIFGLMLFMWAMPMAAILINVKLDRSPLRQHRLLVMDVEERQDGKHCIVREDGLGTFWLRMPKDLGIANGSYIEASSRRGFLGFSWFEHVGVPPRLWPASAPAVPAPTIWDPNTPLEAPDPPQTPSKSSE